VAPEIQESVLKGEEKEITMKKIIEIIEEEIAAAFEQCGYDKKYAKVSISNRPDLCEYQCNGALAAAKEYKKAPIMIANEVVEKMQDNQVVKACEAVMPGFINMKLDETYLARYLMGMVIADKFGFEENDAPKKVLVDYGGPNVAKPLHVGHLRSAVIGESVKRLVKFAGNDVLGDVHLGDWGLQMGLIITELKKRKPDLVYFDEKFDGEYPAEAPFTISELEEIYPAASAKSKEDEEYKKEALDATVKLQAGNKGYRAIWKHILDVSVADLKKNYGRLNVEFDLWKGESDVQSYIEDMVENMKTQGIAYESDGAIVVDVKEESDSKEIPPCIILKSDGAALYSTTDLATLAEREKLYNLDEVIYVADKRQELHFTQVFRTSRKAGIVKDDTKLVFLGFGTMNGKDGKPFKTREGGVMRLEMLLSDIEAEMYKKIAENEKRSFDDEEEARKTAKTVAISAIKYGDLSNQAVKDYIFDIDRFTSFEGNTGPYILYTIVRIKSILKRASLSGEMVILPAKSESEKSLMLELTKFAPTIEGACEELAPHRVCSYIYEIANAFNKFYHETKILSEDDSAQKASWIQLLMLTKNIMECCIDLLGFEAPERM